jgi:hypothetical protein
MPKVQLLVAVLFGWIFSPMAAPAGNTVTVTPLEASHVAAIHTGAVSESIELESGDRTGRASGTQAGFPIYVIHSRRGNHRYRVEVHGIHGRLL